MWWYLFKIFDIIFIIDLYGNSIKKEIVFDGFVDINVFDIK